MLSRVSVSDTFTGTESHPNHQSGRWSSELAPLVSIVVLLACVQHVSVAATPTITQGNNINVVKQMTASRDPSVAVNRANPQNVVVVCDNQGAVSLTLSVSNDGGATFTTRALADGTDGLLQASGQPSIVSDSFGNFFLAYITLSAAPVVAMSSDGGKTFTPVVTLDNSGFQPTVASGPSAAGSTTAAVFVLYQAANGSLAVRGVTVSGPGQVGIFGAAQVVPNSNGKNYGDITVGPKGQVVVAYQSGGSGAGPDTIMTCTDPDGVGAAPFNQPVTASTTNVGGFATITPQNTFGIDAEAGVAYDVSGGLYNGRCYLMYTNSPAVGSSDTNIFVRISDDDGTTWGNAVQVNDDGTTFAQFLPRLAVDPISGAVAISWLDCRADIGSGVTDHDKVPNTDAQVFATASFDGGTTYLANFQVSTGSSNATVQTDGFQFGFYTGLAFYNSVMFPAWPDNSNSTNDNPNGAQNLFNVYTSAIKFTSTTPPGSGPTTPPADLVITGVQLLTQPAAGQPFSFLATVVNQGINDARGFYVGAFNDPKFAAFGTNVETDFTLPPTPDSVAKVDTQFVAGLAAGASTQVLLTMVYVNTGTATLAILADSQRNVPETNEVNNQFNQRITVFAPTVNIVVTSFTGTDVNPGITANFNAVIQNQGNKATGPFSVSYYANRVSAPTAADVADSISATYNLAPGQTVVVPFSLPPQTVARAGRSWVFAAPPPQVPADNKSDNVASAVWGIPNNPPNIYSPAYAFLTAFPDNFTWTFVVGAVDPENDPLSYVWDFGDGSAKQTAPATVSHTFPAPGNYTVTVSVSDGPYSIVQSNVSIVVFPQPSLSVDLGFVIAKAGKVNLAIPFPPGFKRKDRFTSTIVQGTPGNSVALKSQKLTGKPGGPGTYYFTVEYLSVKTHTLVRVGYKYTVIQ